MFHNEKKYHGWISVEVITPVIILEADGGIAVFTLQWMIAECSRPS